MKSVGPWPTIMSFRPEKEQIEFECAGAAVAMASTCSCVRGSVPGGPLTSPAKAAPAVRLKQTAAQIPAANFLRIDVPPHLAALVAAVERSREKSCARLPERSSAPALIFLNARSRHRAAQKRQPRRQTSPARADAAFPDGKPPLSFVPPLAGGLVRAGIKAIEKVSHG
jgi:hypothetical protein